MSVALSCCSTSCNAGPRWCRNQSCNLPNSSLMLAALSTPFRLPVESRLPMAARSQPIYPQGSAVTGSAAYPDYAEEHETFASAYALALNDAKPERLRTPGLQEFAGALWERRRHIPSSHTDPLTHVFMEFDVDGDGRLTAAEIAAALQSRDVKVTVPQIQWAIDAFEERKDHAFISLMEWPDFVFALAAADLKKDHDLSSLSGSETSIEGGDALGSWSSL